jgi:hypothetical protein
MHSTNLYRFCKKIWSLRVCNRYTYSYMPQDTYTKSSKHFEAWFTLTQDLHAIYTYSYWHLHAQHWPGSICVDILRIHNGTRSTMVITSTVALFSTWNVLAHGLPIPWALHIYGRKLLRAHHASKPPLLHRVMPYCHSITILLVWICLKPQTHFSNMYLKRTSKAWRKIIEGITLLIIAWQNLFTYC